MGDPLPPLETRLEMLAGNLDRARRYGTGLILFVVHRAESPRADLERRLLDRLAALGQRARRIQFRPDDPPEARDLLARLRDDPPADDDAVFVYDLRFAFPEVLSSLNYRREYVPDGRWRLLFWALDEEVVRIMRDAPDFWAFVNQTVELPELPPPAERARLAGELAWAGFEGGAELRQLDPDERRARIALRERLLAELPDDEASRAARADLCYTLGGLYYYDGQMLVAEQQFQGALAMARQTGDARLQAWALNGLGTVYRDLGRPDEALDAYRRAVELDPKDAYPWNGLGNVYRDLGRPDEALDAYRRAVELDPKDAYPWNGLGNVYADLGRPDEALDAFRRAVELDPKYAYPHTMLGSLYELAGRLEDALREHQRAVELQPNNGTCHASLASVLRKLGREAEAAGHLARARELMQRESNYNRACLEAIAGDTEAALNYLARALEKAPGDRAWARRDPDLASLRGDPRFEALVGPPDSG